MSRVTTIWQLQLTTPQSVRTSSAEGSVQIELGASTSLGAQRVHTLTVTDTTHFKIRFAIICLTQPHNKSVTFVATIIISCKIVKVKAAESKAGYSPIWYRLGAQLMQEQVQASHRGLS